MAKALARYSFRNRPIFPPRKSGSLTSSLVLRTPWPLVGSSVSRKNIFAWRPYQKAGIEPAFWFGGVLVQYEVMKLITLNIAGGRFGQENLFAFFEKYKNKTDIFCLQEVLYKAPDLRGRMAGGKMMTLEGREAFQEIEKVLDDCYGYFDSHLEGWFGLATFIKKEHEVIERGEFFVHQHKTYSPGEELGGHARNIQYTTIRFPDGLKTIINFHGLWNGKGKEDSDARLSQSDKILQFIGKLKNPFLITGDFNLRPDAESLNKLEDFGLRNLIKEYGVASTRTSIYTKPEKFADYTLVSECIIVREFKVLPYEVSDHFPLFLNFG